MLSLAELRSDTFSVELLRSSLQHCVLVGTTASLPPPCLSSHDTCKRLNDFCTAPMRVITGRGARPDIESTTNCSKLAWCFTAIWPVDCLTATAGLTRKALEGFQPLRREGDS